MVPRRLNAQSVPLVQLVRHIHTLDTLMQATQGERTSLELHQVPRAGSWLVGALPFPR